VANIRKHVAKDGSISYRVQVRYRGVNRYETFPTRKDALQWAVKTESEIINQVYFPERLERSATTVGQLIDQYKSELLPLLSSNTQAAYRGILEYWYRVLGDTPLGNVTSETIDKCKLYLWKDKQYSPY
jgi:hypothetical protein